MANERINFVQNLICNVIAQTMEVDFAGKTFVRNIFKKGFSFG